MGKQQLVMAAMALGMLGACGTYGGGERDQTGTAKVAAQARPGYAAYFGFDSAKLDSEADAAIAAAVEAFKGGRHGRDPPERPHG